MAVQCTEYKDWVEETIQKPVQQWVNQVQQVPAKFTSWIASQILSPIGTWRKTESQKCQSRPWPWSWFCWTVVNFTYVLVWVVVIAWVPVIWFALVSSWIAVLVTFWIAVLVSKWVPYVLCEVIHIVWNIIWLIIDAVQVIVGRVISALCNLFEGAEPLDRDALVGRYREYKKVALGHRHFYAFGMRLTGSYGHVALRTPGRDDETVLCGDRCMNNELTYADRSNLTEADVELEKETCSQFPGDAGLHTGVLLAALALEYASAPADAASAKANIAEHVAEILASFRRLEVAPGYIVRHDLGEGCEESELMQWASIVESARQVLETRPGAPTLAKEQVPNKPPPEVADFLISAGRLDKSGYDKWGTWVTPNLVPQIRPMETAAARYLEPSADQYTGIIVGLTLAHRYVDVPGIRSQIEELADHLCTWLSSHRYWLARPDSACYRRTVRLRRYRQDAREAKADIYTPATIGRSSWQMAADAYAEAVVRIVSGTGSGQARRVTSNTATTLTVDPPWAPAPDSSSVFTVESRVLSWEELTIIGPETFRKYKHEKKRLDFQFNGAGATWRGPDTNRFEWPFRSAFSEILRRPCPSYGNVPDTRQCLDDVTFGKLLDRIGDPARRYMTWVNLLKYTPVESNYWNHNLTLLTALIARDGPNFEVRSALERYYRARFGNGCEKAWEGVSAPLDLIRTLGELVTPPLLGAVAGLSALLVPLISALIPLLPPQVVAGLGIATGAAVALLPLAAAGWFIWGHGDDRNSLAGAVAHFRLGIENARTRQLMEPLLAMHAQHPPRNFGPGEHTKAFDLEYFPGANYLWEHPPNQRGDWEQEERLTESTGLELLLPVALLAVKHGWPSHQIVETLHRPRLDEHLDATDRCTPR